MYTVYLMIKINSTINIAQVQKSHVGPSQELVLQTPAGHAALHTPEGRGGIGCYLSARPKMSKSPNNMTQMHRSTYAKYGSYGKKKNSKHSESETGGARPI